MFGWIKNGLAKVSQIFNAGLASPVRWFVDAVSGGKSDSGISVTEKTALSYPPVWYAVSKISGHVGQLPLMPYKRLERGAEKANTHPAYRLLKTRPNPFMSAIQLKESLMVDALLWGNAKIAIIRDGARRPIELLLIPANCSTTIYSKGEKWHTVTLDKDMRLVSVGGTKGGEQNGNTYIMPDVDVIHIPGLGIDGIAGLQVFDVGKNAIGLGLAAEKASNKHFGNGGRPDVILEAPIGALRDEDDAKELVANWNNYHKGLDNVGRVGLLREGVKANQLDGNAKDSEWIEQRKFQRQEVALLFLLESIIGDDDSVSYNSLEQKNLAYLSNCLMRWLVKIEQECDEKLLNDRQKRSDSHFWKFSTAALLRADFKTTIESLGAAITYRIMSPNEAREKLDMNPYEGGDSYENPAITPGAAGATQDAGTSGNADTNAGDANASSAVDVGAVERMTHLIGVEANNVIAAAEKRRDFCGWLDGFYGKRWRETLSAASEKLGCDPDVAVDHCRLSHMQLIELCGQVTPDGLVEAVTLHVRDWPQRAESLAKKLETKELTNA